MIVFDSNHQEIDLGPPLFEGGEGVIYPVKGQPDYLAKIYKTGKNSGKETKLAYMLANPPTDLGSANGQPAIAWPEILLYAQNGQFVGYLMSRIYDAVTLLHVINPRLRKQILPAFTQKYLHRTARNLAAALHMLHKSDYVVGDLNEANVLVARTAQVTVIDVDSIQVKEKRDAQITFYPCPVGRQEYTPPELQGRYFLNEVRQPEQDSFSLAVLIFQLLLGGNHPFRSTWLGKGDPPTVDEKIVKGLFPYTLEPSGLVKPPPGVSIDHLHLNLALMMRQCFIVGHSNPHKRPTAIEWVSALEDAENGLKTCHCGFEYAFHLKQCPDCGLPSPPSLVRCPACGTQNLDQFVYCQKCAAHLHPLTTCPHCGQHTPQAVQAKFCEYCGRRLK
jgi:DNA-binding helix-hairpin-helix protein with protein kinase domain